MGHLLDDEAATFFDGETAGHCSICGSRVRMKWVPGGDVAVRAKSVALKAMNGDQPDLQALVDELQRLEADKAAINDAIGLIQMAMIKVLP